MHNMMLHLIKKILQTSLDLYRFRVTFRGGGVLSPYSHVKVYTGMCRPNKWVSFSPKILRQVSHFGPKNP